jgi:peptidoglycan hydrolase-like protein with peptidoglycan-binding domain
MLLRELTYHVTEALDAAINAAIIKIKSDGSMWRKVKQGAINSPELKTIQTALTQLGFKAKADGWFGPGTAKAVRDFQKSKGLKVDGDPGPNTLKAMANAVGSGRGKSVEKPGERQAYLDKNKEKPVAQKGEGAYKVITGSGQGTRYKVYDKDGNVISTGRGKGPANIPVKKDPDANDPRGNQIPIANFKGANTDKKVVAVVDNALKQARDNDADANQIAQIVAAGSANFNNVAGPGERADRAKAIIATVTDTELQDPKVRAALAGELLAIDKVKMDPEEALRKFVQSSYAYVIPERFRDKATDKQKFEAMVRKAQDEQMMSAFTDPSKAIKIIQDEIKKIEADPSAGGNAMAAGQKGGDDATKPGKGPKVSTDGPQAPGGNISSDDSGQNSSKSDKEIKLSPPPQLKKTDDEMKDFAAAVDTASPTEKPVVMGMTQEVAQAVEALGGDLSTDNLELLVSILEMQSTKPILQKIVGRRLEKLYSKDDLADLDGIEGDELEAANMLIQLKAALMSGEATRFVYKPKNNKGSGQDNNPNKGDGGGEVVGAAPNQFKKDSDGNLTPVSKPKQPGRGDGDAEVKRRKADDKKDEPKLTDRQQIVLASTAEQLYLSMKGGTGIGTSKNKLRRQLKKIEDKDQYDFVAKEYKKEYGTDLFDHFYDEMSDRNIKKYVAPEMKRLGIEMPERSEFESFTYENIISDLQNFVNERQVWAKSGSKVVRKYRCMTGKRKGRVVKQPSQCFAAPDIKKRIMLKKTKARLGSRMARKAKRTKRTNPTSKRVAQMNKSSR